MTVMPGCTCGPRRGRAAPVASCKTVDAWIRSLRAALGCSPSNEMSLGALALATAADLWSDSSGKKPQPGVQTCAVAKPL